jgi:hypothetical protein
VTSVSIWASRDRSDLVSRALSVPHRLFDPVDGARPTSGVQA